MSDPANPPAKPSLPITPVSQYRIRRMRDSDIERPDGKDVMAIESVSFGAHHWSPSSFANELNNPMARYFVLANDHDDVCGYCGLWMIVDEGHITTVAINPALRGQSLGEVMVAHMLDYAMGKSIEFLTLEVRTSNHTAQNLYYKYGLESQGLRRKYYQDNREDALIMTTPSIKTDHYRSIFKTAQANLLTRINGLPNGFGQG